jgi:hypothetical protein
MNGTVISLNRLLLTIICIVSFLDLDWVEGEIAERTAEDVPSCMV